MTLGNQLRETRKKLGWTQSDLASKCGVTLRTIQRIEKGDVNPSPYTLKKLKENLGDLEELNQETTSNKSTYSKLLIPMQVFLTSITQSKILRGSGMILLLGLFSYWLSQAVFSPTTPSIRAEVETVNCGSNSSCDIQLTVISASGDILVRKIYGGTSYDKASGVLISQDGGFFILGSTSSFGNGNYDILLIKTDELGNTLWEKTYGGFFNEYGKRISIAPSEEQLTIEGTQQVCTTPNVSEYCETETWKFEVDLEGNLKS